MPQAPGDCKKFVAGRSMAEARLPKRGVNERFERLLPAKERYSMDDYRAGVPMTSTSDMMDMVFAGRSDTAREAGKGARMMDIPCTTNKECQDVGLYSCSWK